MINLKTKREIATILSRRYETKDPCRTLLLCGHKGVKNNSISSDQINSNLSQNLFSNPLKLGKAQIDDDVRNDHFFNLLRASTAISDAADYPTLLKVIMTTIIQLSQAKQVLVLKLQGSDLRLEAKAKTTPEGVIVELVNNSAVKWSNLPESFINKVVQTQQPQYTDFNQQNTLCDLPPHFQSSSGLNALCLPMVNNKKLVAIFYIELYLKNGHLNSNRLSALKSVAKHAAAAIEVMRLQSDVNELKQKQEQLEGALRLADISQALSEQLSRTGSWRWDIHNNNFFCSKEFCNIFELDPQQRTISFADFVACIHPDDKKYVLERIHKSIQLKTSTTMEYRILKADGSVLSLSGQGCPVFDSLKLIDYVGIINDKTELRASENALRVAQGDLARLSRVITIGQLTSSIAHEINQPLMSIAANAGAGLRWLHRTDPDLEQVNVSLQSIAAEGHRAGQIVKSLRMLTKNSDSSFSVLDIHDALKSILAIARCELEHNNVSLELNLNASFSLVHGDMVQLQQVMLNLIMNAIEAMSEVNSTPRLIIISTITEKNQVIFVTVEDTGPGFCEQVKNRLFDAFYSTKKDGMGMGLAICHSIVDMHGGELSAALRKPVGSVFSLSLPLLQTKSESLHGENE